MAEKKQELINDNQILVGAKRKGSGYKIETYDDGFGPLFIHRDSMGISGIVRAKTWEDAYSICEDEFFPEANETVEELKKEYGFKREHVKMIHPATRKEHPVTFANGQVEEFDIDYSTIRADRPEDYDLTGGRLLPSQFVEWRTIDTPDPEAWMDNGLFCEAYGFRNSGPNSRDKINHGIYAKDLNGDSLDLLTPELLEDLDIELEIKEWE